MTNFTNEIRRDLLAHPPSTREGAAAALAALIATGASLSGDGFEIVSENERVAEYFVRLTELFGARPQAKAGQTHHLLRRESRAGCPAHDAPAACGAFR